MNNIDAIRIRMHTVLSSTMLRTGLINLFFYKKISFLAIIRIGASQSLSHVVQLSNLFINSFLTCPRASKKPYPHDTLLKISEMRAPHAHLVPMFVYLSTAGKINSSDSQ